MGLIPVVCDVCGGFFVSRSAIGGSGRVVITGSKVGPCPNCGGIGSIPDGIYDLLEDSIRLLSGPATTVQQLQALAALIADARETKASSEEVKKAFEKDLPELASLGGMLPRSRGELYAFLTLLATIVMLLIQVADQPERTSITVNQVIEQVVEDVPSTLVIPAPQDTTPVGPDSLATPSEKVGRNSPCPCGSGMKYKRCCGRLH